MTPKPKAYSYIRLSTPEQIKGDSVRRQWKATEDYVKEMGFDLVDVIHDKGISAFHGKNAAVGALSLFLTMVDAGEIDEGSYLIIESLDRLSRQNVMEAISLFTRIVQAGVNIVTLTDRKVFSKSSVSSNSGDILFAAVGMMRAHEESHVKSVRLSAAWENKRHVARAGKVTKQIIPNWLRFSVDHARIEPVDDRCELVRTVFEMCRDGFGAYSIAKRLNEQKTPTWGKSKFWHESYIKKILGNRSVLGEYQPHKITKEGLSRTRHPEGDPIKDYYPQVVDDMLFHQAQLASSSRRTSGRGRKGINVSNLFSGLLKCAKCGSGMRYIDKGTPPKGGQYLRCSAAVMSNECSAFGTRYSVVEDMLLTWIEGVNFETTVNRDRWERELKRLNEEKHDLIMRYNEIFAQIERCIDALMAAPSATQINDRINLLNAEKLNIQKMISEKEKEIVDLGSSEMQCRSDLIKKIRLESSNDLVDVRRRVSSELKKYIKKISILIRPHEFEQSLNMGKMLKISEIEATVVYRTGAWQVVNSVENSSIMAQPDVRLKRIKDRNALLNDTGL